MKQVWNKESDTRKEGKPVPEYVIELVIAVANRSLSWDPLKWGIEHSSY